MEIFIKNVPYTADYIKVTQQLQSVLHSDMFGPYATSPGLPINFKVYLFPDRRHRRNPHSGRGTLTLPSEKIGNLFLRVCGGYSIRVDDRALFFERSNKPPRPDNLAETQLLPYVDPAAIREKQQRFSDLSAPIELQDVQFAWQCRDDSLSIEWQWKKEDDVLGTLRHSLFDSFSDDIFNLGFQNVISYTLHFNDETREVIVKRILSEWAPTQMITMRYSRIQTVEIDSSTRTILLFLETPPSLEEGTLSMYLELGLNNGSKLKRRKLSHLNATHEPLAPFIWTVLRLPCKSLQELSEFRRMAELVGFHVHDHHRLVERKSLFSPSVLKRKQEWLDSLGWSVAFQCETLHRNLLLDTVELLSLRPSIEGLIRTQGADHATQVLRQFGLYLRQSWDWEDDQTVQSCFGRAKRDIEQSDSYTKVPALDKALFQCLHVDFTPTTIKLRGPFPDTSNRILREYPNNHSSFLRVSFTDEDGLKYRFDRREVDGPNFIANRVGNTLKNGFTLCGRKFQFLAYSQSALKQYTVWFVTPFTDGRHRRIDAEYIRGTIGSSWPGELRRCPARFAARLSQAFTATEPSVIVESYQIDRIPDIERDGYCFSDGNGPVSPDMADAIHNALQTNSGRMTHVRRTPSVFQVRIQGAKGTLSVDSMLRGSKMGLRPSMIKFESIHHNDIEIARSFSRPAKFFLNRPLITILAGLGVDVDIFLSLQRTAVKETEEAAESFKGAAGLFEKHGLGIAFALPSTFSHLRKLNVDLEPQDTPSGIRDAFTERCLKFAVHHVLREIKFKARIPVPESWKLVGVVDEHCYLRPNEIYACVLRGEGANKEYLKGPILISKSPTIHPGDVQIATAIGAPPAGSPLNDLCNCVVFSQQGNRPLPNKLSGSDLDGDEYDLILLRDLHPPRTVDPGSYQSTPRLTLDRDSNIDDVADFVVNFINNDVLGIVATNFLLIADSKGIFAPDCQKLAELHSWAVDFPKNGVHVPFEEIPQPQMSVKPDWYAPEIGARLEANYYESKSALGRLFRDIHLPAVAAISHDSRAQQRRRRTQENLSLEDTFQKLSLDTGLFDDRLSTKIHRRLTPLVDLQHTEECTSSITQLFDHFASELEHICYSHTLSRKANARLTEEEVLVGTIVAKSTQPRMRQDTIAAMRDESSALVHRMWKELEGGEDSPIKNWVNRSWTAWKVSLVKKDLFGSKSFGWIALRAIFEAIKRLEE